MIAIVAQAQDYQAPTYAAPNEPSLLMAPDGQRQHFVQGHVNGKGQYVAPHYEAKKPLHFRGYFAADAQARKAQQQHGYQEPSPVYAPPEDDTAGKKVEGR